MKLRPTLAGLVFGLAAALPAFAQTPQSPPQVNSHASPDTPPGQAIYDTRCALCHDNPGDTRAMSLPAMRGMSKDALRAALTGDGKMAPMAAGISAADLTTLIGWLTEEQKPQAAAPAAWDAGLQCSPDRRSVKASAPITSRGYGVDATSTRRIPAKQAGLKTADMAGLEMAWAIALPRTQTLGTGVTVLGDTAFTSAGGKLVALDPASGCIKWSYEIISRNTPAIGEIGGAKVVALADRQGVVHVLKAESGDLVWKANGRPERNASYLDSGIRGGVVIHGDKVIVPISASGVAAGMNPKYECCEGHGAVVALSAKDGAKLWEYHTMPHAEYNGQVSPTGVKQKGPSGAPIWSVPTIDAKRNRVIVTTGENTSYPATKTSDAIIAIDLDTGKEVWVFQAMESDVWNMACGAVPGNAGDTGGPNCPWQYDEKKPGRDLDFGAQAVIVPGGGGKDIVLAGQKSGQVWALDAETGAKLWEQRVGAGSPLGGVHWGIASDGKRVFVPISDPFPKGEGPFEPAPGVHALDVKTGKLLWSQAAKPSCEGERGKLVSGCKTRFGFSAAPIVVDGAVLAGTLDGKLFAFDAKTGAQLKEFDTIGPQKTLNAVEGKGGSIDSHGVSAGGGAVFVASGYAMFGQTAGNVLIALRPKP